MNSSAYRCVLIGCGWIGAKVAADSLADGVQSHAEAYERCNDTILVGLCDEDDNALIWASARWPSANAYNDVDKLLQHEQPDIVSICTPDDTHYAVCQQVLNTSSVKAIIIEKPIATNLDDAKAFLAEASRKNIAIIVNYSRRFSASHAAIKKQIDEGEIGEIIAVTGAYSKGILHNGSHWFDLARWLVGEITQVEAWESAAQPANDPTCHVRVNFKRGVQGFLLAIDANAFSIFELDLIGTLGRVRITNTGHQIELSRVEKSEYYSGYYALGRPKAEAAGFKNIALQLVENAVQVLRKDSLPLCSGLDGLVALTISETVRRSLSMQKCLNINYQWEL